MNMDRKSVAILVLSLLVAVESGVLLCTVGADRVFHLIFNMRGYDKPVPLNQAVELRRGNGSILGHLEKGTVLFPPCQHDMGITDPGNPIWKVYLEVHVSGLRGNFSDIEASNLCNLAEIHALTKSETRANNAISGEVVDIDAPFYEFGVKHALSGQRKPSFPETDIMELNRLPIVSGGIVASFRRSYYAGFEEGVKRRESPNHLVQPTSFRSAADE